MARKETSVSLKDVAVDLATASRITGVSERRLIAWDARGLLSPQMKRSISKRNTVRLYEFQELVEIRVVTTLLERRLSLPHIHRVVDYLRRARGFASPLSQLAFAVVGRRIYFQLPDGTWEGEKLPKQIVIHSVLNLEVIRDQLRAALQSQRRKAGVEQRRKVFGHKPVFSNTRTPVEAVEAFVKRGKTDEEILAAYPHLTKEDIDLARSLATSA